jgi:hypothetical protein
MAYEMAITARHGARLSGRAPRRRQLRKMNVRLFHVRTHPDRVDANSGLRGLAAFTEALTVTSVELLDQGKDAAL